MFLFVLGWPAVAALPASFVQQVMTGFQTGGGQPLQPASAPPQPQQPGSAPPANPIQPTPVAQPGIHPACPEHLREPGREESGFRSRFVGASIAPRHRRQTRLESTVTSHLATVDSKPLTETLSPLSATLTEKRGGRGRYGLTRHPTKRGCPERPSRVKDLSRNFGSAAACLP